VGFIAIDRCDLARPHFEKMLYDQAQLAIVYTEAYQITHDRLYCEYARSILDFTLREMHQPRGGFASARMRQPIAPESQRPVRASFTLDG